MQLKGLQGAYINENDRSLKMHTHMLLALAYVPVNEVRRVFTLLQRDCPGELDPIVKYFKKAYVGTNQRNPRYPPIVWNQHEAAINNTHKTNNASEGFHNRLNSMIGKHHPDMYTALTELQREQADTEAAIAELSLGRRVKMAPKKKWMALQNKIGGIVTNYPQYKADHTELEYLKALAHTIVLEVL